MLPLQLLGSQLGELGEPLPPEPPVACLTHLPAWQTSPDAHGSMTALQLSPSAPSASHVWLSPQCVP